MGLGLVVWAVIIGVALAYQGFALVHNNDRWPAFSDILQAATRNPVGRWVVRGLAVVRMAPVHPGLAVVPSSLVIALPAPFLAQPHAGAEPKSWVDVLRHDVSPVLATYLVYLAILVAHARHGPRRARDDGRAPGWPDLFRHMASTVLGGYLFFLLIVVVFYFELGSEPTSFITQALGQGSLLAFCFVVPGFLVLSLVADRLKRSGRGGQKGSRGRLPLKQAGAQPPA